VNVRKEGRKYNYKNDDVMEKVWESNASERTEEDTRKGQRMERKYYFRYSDGPCAKKWKEPDGVSVSLTHCGG
jgi:hypothetical protein